MVALVHSLDERALRAGYFGGTLSFHCAACQRAAFIQVALGLKHQLLHCPILRRMQGAAFNARLGLFEVGAYRPGVAFAIANELLHSATLEFEPHPSALYARIGVAH